MKSCTCELIMAISTLTCWIAQDRTTEEIRQISNIYRILSQNLDAYANQELFCSLIEKRNSEESNNTNDSDSADDSDDTDDCDDDSNCTSACEYDCSDDCYEFEDFYDSKDPACY